MSTMAIIIFIQLFVVLLIGIAILAVAKYFSKFTAVNIRLVLSSIGIIAMSIVMISWLFQGEGLSTVSFILPLIVIVILFGMIRRQKKTLA